MLATALGLARRNLAVFPCRARRKEPATLHGCKDATTDTSKIRDWWQAQPDLNVAVATGAISNIFVLDIDGLDSECALRKLESMHGSLPQTVESLTARGRHIWFKHPGALIANSTAKIAPGIDVRGDGGYILSPPSVHPSGRVYAWSVDSAAAFADAPGWLLHAVSTPASKINMATTPPEQWRELVKGVVEGTRDSTTAKLAGYLLRRSVDPFVVLELLQGWNTTRCAPPLPESDIERIVDSIAGKELKRRQADGR